MKLLGVKKAIVHGYVRLSGHVQREGSSKPLEVYFEFPEELANLVAENADPFIPALLLPAMAERESLEIAPSVSRRLWKSLPLLQEIFAAWYPETLATVTVQAMQFRGANAGSIKPLTGAFFSLGVDSFHTLLRHEKNLPHTEKITHLIHMTGFESRLQECNDARDRPVIKSVEEVARRWHKTAICGRTNLRDCFHLRWGHYYHGAGLAAVALALSGGLGKVLVPSSYSWKYLKPWPSHPLTDTLWSSDDLEIIHDGTGDDRVRKLAGIILEDSEAVRQLRVCLVTEGGPGNCGFCAKCIRTMITLQILGALQISGVFPPCLPRDFWRRLDIKTHGELSFAEENLRLAREKQSPPWIVAGLERAIALGRLELLRRERGDLNFTRELLGFTLARTLGRIPRYFYRRQERAFKIRTSLPLRNRSEPTGSIPEAKPSNPTGGSPR